MGFIESIKRAYSALSGGNGGKTDKATPSHEQYVGFLRSSELEEDAMTEEEQLLSSLDSETRAYISKNASDGSKKLLPPRVIPLHMLSDTPTASQVLALLGMIRWCMENGKVDGKKYEIRLVVSNRGDSPFLVGMGDKAIPAVPATEEYRIGS